MEPRQRVEIPQEIKAILSGGVIKSIEYGDKYIIVHIDPVKFFNYIASQSGIEFVVECKNIVMKMPLNFDELLNLS